MARTSTSGGVTELEIQNSVHTFAVDAEASDTYAIDVTPAVTAYVVGQRFAFQANTANTGAATLDVNGLGPIAIKKHSNAALADNDIKADSIVEVFYDGTNFQMVSMLSNAPAGAGDMVAANNLSDVASAATSLHNLADGTVLTAATVAGTDKVLMQDTDGTDVLKTATATSIAALATPEGTAVLSTGEAGGTKFLREDGDGTSSWQAVTGFAPALGADDNYVTDAQLVVIGNTSGANTGDEPTATDIAEGVVELATDAETVTGTATNRATTPANITAKMAAPGAIGGTTPAAVTATTLTTTGGIELGHASDTTISRVSAGLIAVEGSNLIRASDVDDTPVNGETAVPVSSNWAYDHAAATAVHGISGAVVGTTDTQTLSAKTLSGAIPLEENASVDLDAVLSADGKYTGIAITGTAGAALAFGDLVYLAAADSRWELCDASAVGTAGTVLVGICVLAAAGDASATKVLLQGTIRADTAFPALTISAPVYISETAGDVTQTAPTTADAVVRVLGYAITADSMFFNPSPDHITHTG